MPTYRVYYGKGAQTLRFIPHRDGRPVRVTGATYGILDARYGEGSDDQVLVAEGTAAVLDPASTTLTARAGRAAPDRRRLSVASSADFFEGRSYYLEAADGRGELVRIARVVSGSQLLAAAELAGDYALGATLRGVQLAATFPGDAADDDGNLDGMPWLLVWSLGDLPPVRESIYLERAEEALLANHDALVKMDPTLATVGGDRNELALALAQAQDDFRIDLRLAGADEADLLTGPLGQSAVLYRAAYHALKGANDEAAIRRCASYQDRYTRIVAALQTGTKKPEVTVLDRTSAAAVARNPANLFRTF